MLNINFGFTDCSGGIGFVSDVCVDVDGSGSSDDFSDNNDRWSLRSFADIDVDLSVCVWGAKSYLKLFAIEYFYER